MQTKRSTVHLRLAVGLLIVPFGLAGCSQAASPNGVAQSTTAVPAYTGPVPTFTGPYAEQFTDAYKNSTTEFEREILSDGVVEKAELSEAQKRWVTCMKDRGFDASVTYGEVGSYVVKERSGYTLDTAGDVVRACGEGTTDYVENLYLAITQNPTNKDFATLMVECYRRLGLVGADYTPDRYTQEGKTGAYSFSTTDPRFDRCSLNPQAQK